MTRRINAAGLSLVKAYEGLRLTAYPDPASGGDPWTIGYGHTGKDVKPGLRITQGQADDLLAADLARFEAAVAKYVKVPLNDNQFSALVSFTFNLGERNLAGSTLLKKLNAGNYAAVPSELMKWVNASGKRMEGLVRRRRAEGQLWDMPMVKAPTPTETQSPSPTIPIPGKPEPAPAGNGGALAVAGGAVVLALGAAWAWLIDLPCNLIGVLCQ